MCIVAVTAVAVIAAVVLTPARRDNPVRGDETGRRQPFWRRGK